jgi:mannose-6-phosphate isomerase-like protein (cupin superfamily)
MARLPVLPVHEVGSSLSVEMLEDLACGVAAAEPYWRQHVVHDRFERQPVRLLATDLYEVWVIGWAQGQGVELHDHGESAGCLVVVEGELTEEVVHNGIKERVALPTGSVRDLPVGVVHEVSNRRAAPATSIHVYSPPLTLMNRFDGDSYELTAVEVLDQEPPVVADATAMLHPSNLS